MGQLILVAALMLAAGCTKQVALVKGIEPVIAGTLVGGTWLVEDINGGGVIDNARLEIGFGGDGAVSGHSGCNRFRGAWRHAGATIALGPLTGTRMACAPALMDMEMKFLGVLAAATAVRFDATGAVLLMAPDGRVVKLRREGK